MPLILRPTIAEFSREELEAHIEGIRMRRMAIAFDYQAGVQLKLEESRNRLQRKYGEHVQRLGKELETLDRALAKIEKRMDDMTALQQEDSLLSDLIRQQQITSTG